MTTSDTAEGSKGHKSKHAEGCQNCKAGTEHMLKAWKANG